MKKGFYKWCLQIAARYELTCSGFEKDLFLKLIGSIMKNRRTNLPITADFAPAFKKYRVPTYKTKNYASALAEAFNLRGRLVRNGSSWAMYARPALNIERST